MSDVVLIERLAGAVLTVACVLGGLRFTVARFGRFAETGAEPVGRRVRVITVLESAYLPGAASVHLVRVGPRLLVIGRSGGAVVNLCELDSDAHPHR